MIAMGETKPQLDAHWRSVRRVLVIRLDNLGDVLVTTPAMHAIRESLPDAEITLLASEIGAQAGRLNPDLDDVIVYQAPWMDPWSELPQDSEREQRMIAEIRERRFDGAIIFTSYHQSSLPGAYLCYLADIPLRVAASIDGPGSLLTTRHKHPDRMMHEVERGLDLVGAIGMTTQERSLSLQVPEVARCEIADFLDAECPDRSGPLVVIHPGCSMPARTYAWQSFAAVAELLIQQLGATIVLTGVASERPLVDQVAARVDGSLQSSIVKAAGRLSFPVFCALIEAADVTVTNNTGPMHVSAAVQTPVVALFALTNPPEQWGPWQVPHRQLYHDVSCRICYQRICPFEHECLSLVTPEMVADAVDDLLREVSAGRLVADAGGLERAEACR